MHGGCGATTSVCHLLAQPQRKTKSASQLTVATVVCACSPNFLRMTDQNKRFSKARCCQNTKSSKERCCQVGAGRRSPLSKATAAAIWLTRRPILCMQAAEQPLPPGTCYMHRHAQFIFPFSLFHVHEVAPTALQ